MKILLIRERNKLFKQMRRNKTCKKNKKEMKMIIHIANRNFKKTKKKKKAHSQMKQEVTTVKVDLKKVVKNKLKNFKNYKITMEDKINTMSPKMMIKITRKIITKVIGSIQTMIIEILVIIRIKQKNL